MQKVSFFVSLMLLALLGYGCQESATTQHVYIISTNDIHANIDAMPRLATLVKDYEAKGEVLVVDSGDRVTGNAYVDDDSQPGIPMIELMNEVGYDVVTLGNHEFDKGRKVLNAMVTASDFRWVCANMQDLSGNSAIEPYTTITLGGVTLGFVGIVDTDQDGHPLGGESAYVDFTFTDDSTTAYDVCQSVAKEADYVVLLSHMGLDMDRRLLAQLPACDWIAGGHSHDTVNESVGETHISQNRKDLRYVTVADITVDGGAIVDVAYTQIEMQGIKEDSHLRSLVDELKARDPELNTVEARANDRATKDGIANFTVEALRSYTYDDGFVPEIAIYHYGGVRLSAIEAGDIKRVDILNNDPFVSTIYIGEMTLEEIRDFILTKYNSGTAEKPDKESHYAYFRSNIPYQIILGTTPEAAPDATAIRFDLEERRYRVAMCNYIAENYIDREVVERGLRKTDVTVREAMLRLVRTFGEAGYTPDNRVYQTEVTE